MAFFGALGKALKAPLKPINKAVGKLPGMGAVQRGVQKAPGVGAVGGKLGLGPSNPQQQVQQAPPPQMQPNMQSAVQNAGQAVGQAFNRPRPMQPGMQNMMQGGAQAVGRMMPGYARPQLPPMQPPPPQEMQEQAPPLQGPEQEMMQQKIQQMEAMRPQVGMGGRFGLGPSIGARPHVMPRFGRMMQPQEQPMMQPMQDQAQGMDQMPMPNASVDEDRVNRFRQMRQGGIGPRFGGGGPMQY